MGEQNKAKMLEVRETREHYKLGGSAEKIKKLQHDKGKLSARERIDLLFDQGTFVEYGLFAKPGSREFELHKTNSPGDGIVIGYGEVNGRTTFAFAQDYTVLGGSVGETHARKMVRIIEEAGRNHCPVVYLWDSGGGRIHESHVTSMYKVFTYNSLYSGFIPQVSAIMGTCAGGSAYSPILSNLVITVDKTSRFYICGPSVIKLALGEDVDEETLAGAWSNNSISGNSHKMAANDEDCINQIKQYLSYMPQSCDEQPPIYLCDDDPERLIFELDDLVPDEQNKPYDMWSIINLLVDTGSAFEIYPYWAKNMITTLARIDGQSVGIIANQPKVLAGCIDINASDKMSHFINTCDCYNIPLIYLVDTPGYLPGTNQEHGGIIRHGAKAVYATANATVPKIQVVVRKAFGGANISMGGNLMNMDANFLWPSFNFGIMSPEAACKIIVGSKMREAATPEEAAEIMKNCQTEFTETRTWQAQAGYFDTDDVIEPNQTRRLLIKSLKMLKNKDREMVLLQHPKKRHGINPE